MIYIKGMPYRKISEVAKIVDVHPNTLRNWDKFGDKLEEEGQQRPIPKSYRPGTRGIRYWNDAQIEEIEKYKDKDKYGELAYFNRAEWGDRGKHLPNYKNQPD
jgi:hypothetical protein